MLLKCKVQKSLRLKDTKEKPTAIYLDLFWILPKDLEKFSQIRNFYTGFAQKMVDI